MDKGQTVYTTNGEAVEFIAEVPGEGFAVWRLFEGCAGDALVEFRGEHPILVDRVYETPPTAVQEEGVAKLAETAERLRAEVGELRREKLQLEEDARRRSDGTAELKARLSQHAALARIDDFLCGRITHFVMRHYSEIEVKTAAEALASKDEGRNGDGMKLLSLFGHSEGQLDWRINDYKDGSGQWISAWPFASEEEATTFAKQKVVEVMAGAIGNAFRAEYALKSAAKLGVEPLPELAEFYRDHRLAGLRSNAERLRQELALSEAQIDRLAKGGDC